MCEFKKENHIEISDGDTLIVSTKDCPLKENEATSLGISVKIGENSIPCCICTAYLDSGDIDVQCPHFYKTVLSEEKGFSVDCALLEPRKSMLKHE